MLVRNFTCSNMVRWKTGIEVVQNFAKGRVSDLISG